MSSNFGTLFHITTWGESHGSGLGVVVDGCPAGLFLSKDDILPYIKRRKPGESNFSTERSEDDDIEILSGIFNGVTTGTPISILIRNKDYHSSDYNNIANCYRPGHADYTFDMKYGFRDYRGGGRSSGRETVARVAAGAIALKLLKEFNIDVLAYTRSIGNISISENLDIKREDILKSPLFMPDLDSTKKAEDYLLQLKSQKNSAGGVVECIVKGLPAGLGEPVFDKLDAVLGKALFSIGAVKAVEVGSGIKASLKTGLENNDPFTIKDGKVQKSTNNSGGVLGGISDGDTLTLRAYFKPTPSIGSTQKTVNNASQEINLDIKGRHDPIIVPRAVVVVESMVGLVLADLFLQNSVSRLDSLKKLYT